ncbi:hypothetical protein NM688_g3422 [Phlebia brevispora]|uniref:Uncharacterized protein n=1 Tax=Phlebia brevispora TaxID=194682 RepID=A0ACC1T5Z4_9APHY|nr:hypothetical protein NM688_g3422 [Phlebia brevispora]
MSTLSSVVSNLVRAQMGASVSSTVADDDLDRHVAELILKEAKQKLEKYNKDGIKAYLPQAESNAPKTNKRFLSSIIRSTDDHNKTILRAQAQAAQEVRQERIEQEKRERKARAEEAVQAERMRRLMGRGGVEWSHNWDRGESRDRRKRDRSWERRDDEESTHPSRKGKERADRDWEREDREERRSKRHRERSPDHEESKSRRSRRRERDYDHSPSPARSADSSYDRRRERREHRRSYHHRSRRSKSPAEYSDASPPQETSRHRHERSHRRHRDRRSRSPDRRKKDAIEADNQEAPSRLPSPADSRRAEEAFGPSCGEPPSLDESSASPSKPPSPPPASPQRERSSSPLIGLPPPSTVESESGVLKEDAPRRKLKTQSQEDEDVSMVPSGSAIPSRATSPGYSRASSKLKEQVETASSSSHTLFSTPHFFPFSRTPSFRHLHLHQHLRPSALDSVRVREQRREMHLPSLLHLPPPLPAHLPSKMDKYFEETYDPRLDVAPLALPSIPSTGLISDAEFAGWDAMLEVIRQRREDREEKKRLDRLGVSDKTKDKAKKNAKDGEGTSEAVDLMSIQYKKRGSEGYKGFRGLGRNSHGPSTTAKSMFIMIDIVHPLSFTSSSMFGATMPLAGRDGVGDVAAADDDTGFRLSVRRIRLNLPAANAARKTKARATKETAGGIFDRMPKASSRHYSIAVPAADAGRLPLSPLRPWLDESFPSVRFYLSKRVHAKPVRTWSPIARHTAHFYLSGIVATQVFMYRRSYPDDRRRNKLMVSAVWLLDLVHSGFIIASLFRYVMLGLTDVHAIQHIYWTVSVTISITGVLTFLVQCFFTIRVWTLSKRNKWLCGLIIVLAFARMVSAFGTVAEMQRFHTWRAFHRGAAWIFTTGLAISTAVDFLIALSLLWFLKRSRTGFTSMDLIIDMIMVYTVENGLLTSMCTVASFVCWLTMPRNFIFLGLHFCISKLYANSFLATLNARAHIKERSTSSREQHNSYHMPTILSAKSIRRDKSSQSRTDQVIPNAVQVSIEKTVVTDAHEGSTIDGDIESLTPAYTAKRASTDTPFADIHTIKT